MGDLKLELNRMVQWTIVESMSRRYGRCPQDPPLDEYKRSSNQYPTQHDDKLDDPSNIRPLLKNLEGRKWKHEQHDKGAGNNHI
jgi:hypothetical protein